MTTREQSYLVKLRVVSADDEDFEMPGANEVQDQLARWLLDIDLTEGGSEIDLEVSRVPSP